VVVSHEDSRQLQSCVSAVCANSVESCAHRAAFQTAVCRLGDRSFRVCMCVVSVRVCACVCVCMCVCQREIEMDRERQYMCVAFFTNLMFFTNLLQWCLAAT
jgi:hypothetical protein